MLCINAKMHTAHCIVYVSFLETPWKTQACHFYDSTTVQSSHTSRGGFSLPTLSSADGSDVSVMNVMVFTVEQSWDGALCCTGQSC